MISRSCICLLFVLRAIAAVPAPKEHFGYTPGDDHKLADYADIIGYFKKLEQSSDRIRLREFGKTSHGKPMFVAFISSAGNLKKLDRYREISRRLALGEAAPAEAQKLAEEGRAIVWIDAGLHATEVAPAQHSPHLAYRMITDDGEEIRRIREQVILLQVPVINPDGLDWVAHWYRQNVGTPHELAALPRLYQKYAGHDNNRDYFMLNLDETRHVSRMLFQEWFPQIVYNQHQTGPFPARIFVPPYAEPLNPHIPATVMEGINLIGSAMKERFARENKPGVLSYWGYDAWWNGGLRSAPAFHNMHGILTETALYTYATPGEYKLSDLPDRFGNGIPTKEPSVFYQRPWLGGTWRLRDAIEYNLTADFAILDLASTRRVQFLMKAWEMARAAIEAGHSGPPYAYLVPIEQWDRSAAHEMLDRLHRSGIQVFRAQAAFSADGKSYPEGTFVLPAGQPFRAYVVDLMEPHKYPEIKTGVTGPTKRPYDIAGWTLSMQMGVAVDRVNDRFEAKLEKLDEIPFARPALDHRLNSSFLLTRDAVENGRKVRWSADGAILVSPGEAFNKALYELRRPRVALYEPWTPNMDQGWTQWVFDTYSVPYTLVHNQDFQNGDLRPRFDTLVLASQTAESILHGLQSNGEEAGESRSGARPRSIPRPEHIGGIGVTGLAAIERFVRGGGTLVALNAATELPIQFYGLPVRNVLRRSSNDRNEGPPSAASQFYCPGSLLRITVDNTHPIAFGMPRDAVAFSSGGPAFDITNSNQARSVARYATSNLLASGWLSGERAVLGKSVVVEAQLGSGRVILFGIRPQHRGQPFGTFKLLLNSVWLGSAQKL
jgi:hypothetical protein